MGMLMLGVGLFFLIDALQALLAFALMGLVCGVVARWWPQRPSVGKWIAPVMLGVAMVAAFLMVLSLDAPSWRVIGQRAPSAAHVRVPAFLRLWAMLSVFVPVCVAWNVLLDGWKLYGRREALGLLTRLALSVLGCALLGWVLVTVSDAGGPVYSKERALGVWVAWPMLALFVVTGGHVAWVARVMTARGLSRLAGVVILVLPTCLLLIGTYMLFKAWAGDWDFPGRPAAHVFLGAVPGDILPTGVALLRWGLAYVFGVVAMAGGVYGGIRMSPRPGRRVVLAASNEDIDSEIQKGVIRDRAWDAAPAPVTMQSPALVVVPVGVSEAMREAARRSHAVPDLRPEKVAWFLRLKVHVVFWYAAALWLLWYPFNLSGGADAGYLSDGLRGMANFAANVLLFVPCGLVLVWNAVSVAGVRQRKETPEISGMRSEGGLSREKGGVAWQVVVWAVGVGAAVSLVGEAVQMLMPGRYSSWADLLANTAGSLFGAMIGVEVCARWERKRRRLAGWFADRRWARAAVWSVLLVGALWLMPFDLSPERSELARGWREALESFPPLLATFDWLRGLGPLDAMLQEWIVEVLPTAAVYGVMAWLMGRAVRESFERRGDMTSPAFFVLVMGVGVALVMEVMQWPVHSRVMDATGLVSAFTGVLAGVLVDMAMGGGVWRGGGGSAQVIGEVKEQVVVEQREAVREVVREEARETVRTEVPRGGVAEEIRGFEDSALGLGGGGGADDVGVVEASAWRRVWVGLGVCLLLAVMGSVVVRLPGVPYNWPKLVRGSLGGVPAMFGLGVAVLLLGGGARWVVERVTGWWGAAVGMIAVAGGVAMVLVAMVPSVMVEKLAGAPVWGTAYYIELWLRLSGFLLGWVAALMVGWVCVGATRLNDETHELGTQQPWPAGWVWLWALVGALISRTVVVTWACTDNITELIDGGGDPALGFVVAWPGELWLGLMLAWIGVNAAVVGNVVDTLVFGNGWKRAWGVAWVGAGMLPAAAVGFVLFNLGTVQSLAKYDVTFSAAQFVLGANRAATLSDAALLARWCVLYGAVVIVLGVAGGLFGGPVKHRREIAAAQRGDNNAVMLAAAALWSALLVYGSIVPLAFRGMTMSSAVARFHEVMRWDQLGGGDRFDWVTNALLFGAAAFVWMLAVAGATRSVARRAVSAVAVWAGVVAMGAVVEFVQLFTTNRITSINDVMAQGVGAGLAVVLYVLFGRAWTAPLRRLITRQAGDVVGDVLLLYLAGYVLYAVMPLDVAMSWEELRGKWEGGMIELRPFGFAWRSWGEMLWGVGSDAALAVPVGVLLGRWFGARAARRGTTGNGAWRAVLAGAGLMAVMELLQLPPMSRVVDVTDVLTGGLGVVIGVWLSGRSEAWWIGRSSRWYITAAAVYAAALMAGYTWPWDFEPGDYTIRAVAHLLGTVPFMGLHAGSIWVALDQVLRKILLGLPLGVLMMLAVYQRGSGRKAWVLCVLISGAWLMMIEIVQLGVLDRTGDATDAMLGMIGVVGGMLIGWNAGNTRKPHPRNPTELAATL